MCRCPRASAGTPSQASSHVLSTVASSQRHWRHGSGPTPPRAMPSAHPFHEHGSVRPPQLSHRKLHDSAAARRGTAAVRGAARAAVRRPRCGASAAHTSRKSTPDDSRECCVSSKHLRARTEGSVWHRARTCTNAGRRGSQGCAAWRWPAEASMGDVSTMSSSLRASRQFGWPRRPAQPPHRNLSPASKAHSQPPSPQQRARAHAHTATRAHSCTVQAAHEYSLRTLEPVHSPARPTGAGRRRWRRTVARRRGPATSRCCLRTWRTACCP